MMMMMMMRSMVSHVDVFIPPNARSREAGDLRAYSWRLQGPAPLATAPVSRALPLIATTDRHRLGHVPPRIPPSPPRAP